MSHLYFIRMGDTNHFKIGVTHSLPRRVKQLQTGNPFPLWVFRSVHVVDGSVKELERTLHQRYHTHRMMGEWFNLKPDDVDRFIKEWKKLTTC